MCLACLIRGLKVTLSCLDIDIVGRLDAVVDRRAHLLTVRNVHLEARTRPSAALATAVAGTLWDLATFLQAEEVLVLSSEPPEFAELLSTALTQD